MHWLLLLVLAAAVQAAGPASFDPCDPKYIYDKQGVKTQAEMNQRVDDRCQALVSDYKAWHTWKLAQPYEKTGPKEEVVVWKPKAGLGDSLGRLEAAFRAALGSKRLFFADWVFNTDETEPLDWTLAVSEIVFRVDWSRATTSTIDTVTDTSTANTGHTANTLPVHQIRPPGFAWDWRTAVAAGVATGYEDAHVLTIKDMRKTTEALNPHQCQGFKEVR
jgi:hypothetical protein